MRTTTSPRPPLTKRLRPGHWAAIDYIIAGGVGLILFAKLRPTFVHLVAEPYGPVPGPAGGRLASQPIPLAGELTLLIVAMAMLAVALRRRRPALMLGLLLAASVMVSALSGSSSAAFSFFLPVAYVLYLIAANYEARQVPGRVLGAVLVTLLVDDLLLSATDGRPPANLGTLIPVVLGVAIAWSTGYTVRQRRRYAVGLQEEAASKAVAEERLRIARELHDVVAHSMSVIAVQAGYGQYVIDSQPADAREALGAIQATSREALDEMRRMLGALRHADEAGTGPAGPVGPVGPAGPVGPLPRAADGTGGLEPYPAGRAGSGAGGSGAGGDDGLRPADALGILTSLFRQSGAMPAAPSTADTAAAPLYPAPGLADLDRLVARTGSAGVQVALRRRGEPRSLPPSFDLSAYRIIQEALTNVVKHAHASRCEVLLGYGDAELTIRVTDSGAGVTVPAPPIPALAGTVAGTGAATLRAARGALANPLPSLPGGHGIIGMRERVSLLGGEFSAGPLPGYGFEVLARIPFPLPAGGRA